MASIITLRIDDATRRRLARLARQAKTTQSHVVREAIEAWVAGHESPSSAYEGLADLIGTVKGADPGLSTSSGKRFAEILKARRRRS